MAKTGKMEECLALQARLAFSPRRSREKAALRDMCHSAHPSTSRIIDQRGLDSARPSPRTQ